MGDSARDVHHSAPALRAAIAAVLRGSPRPAAAGRALRAGALSGLCIVSLVPPAGALSLGELEVHSRLGEPLEAQLPLTLGTNESLAAGCVSQGQSTDGLARLPQLRVQAPVASQPGTYTVRLSTQQPLHEPMYGIELMVACPGTPVMVRQYVLMLDLPGSLVPAAAATAPAAAPAGRPVVTSAARAPSSSVAATASPASRPATAPRSQAAARAPAPARSPISQGSRYRVAAGDTLSLIAQRVAGRNGVGIWEMAALIQQANPAAFINGNADLVRLGSELLIPALDGALPATAEAAAPAAVLPPPLPADAPAPQATEPATAAAPMATGQPAPAAEVEPAAVEIAPAVAAPSTPAEGLPSAALTPDQAPLALPEETPVESPVAIPFAAPLPEPAAEAASTAASAATGAVAAPSRRGANPLLATAVGIGLGLLISLLFGRISLAGLRRGQTGPRRQPGSERTPAPTLAAGAAASALASRAVDDAGITVVETPAESQEPAADRIPERAAPAAVAGTAPTTTDASAPAGRPLAGIDWRDLDEDITDELSALFGDEDLALPGEASSATAGEVPALSGDTVQAAAVEQTDLDSVDPTSTAEISGLDWDTLDVAVDEPPPAAGVTDTAGSALDTGSMAALAASTAIDLPALAASATHDEKLSESLIEALKLLEQDYQQEMTATQIAQIAEPTATEEIQSVLDGDTAEHPEPLRRQRTG